MSRDVEYVFTYSDGTIETTTLAEQKACSRIKPGDNITYEPINETALVSALVLKARKGYPSSSGFSSDMELRMLFGMTEFSLHETPELQLVRIEHQVSPEEERPPCTGLYFDRDKNRIWFDAFHGYYALIADGGDNYMVGADYTPKPPFNPIVTHEEITTKEEA